MKHNKFSESQKQKSADSPQTIEIDFAPSPDAVARKAYFSYVNQGSPQGHEVQHWLDAEKQLIEERNLTRVHGFHNKT